VRTVPTDEFLLISRLSAWMDARGGFRVFCPSRLAGLQADRPSTSTVAAELIRIWSRYTVEHLHHALLICTLYVYVEIVYCEPLP